MYVYMEGWMDGWTDGWMEACRRTSAIAGVDMGRSEDNLEESVLFFYLVGSGIKFRFSDLGGNVVTR